jgi:hypothetical protein
MFDPACADAWRAAILSSTQFRNAERIMHGIGHCPMMPSLDHGRRRALKLLAGSSYGRTESALLAHGIHPAALIGLFNAGLATASVETLSAGQRTIDVTRLQITPKGRKAIDAPAI